MGPGGLKRRKSREARAHADNDGRHEATRQDEITARYPTPYTLTAPPTRHHTTPLLRSIPGVHNKAQPQMSSGPARAAARQGPFRSGALDVVTAAGTGPHKELLQAVNEKRLAWEKAWMVRLCGREALRECGFKV